MAPVGPHLQVLRPPRLLRRLPRPAGQSAGAARYQAGAGAGCGRLRAITCSAAAAHRHGCCLSEFCQRSRRSTHCRIAPCSLALHSGCQCRSCRRGGRPNRRAGRQIAQCRSSCALWIGRQAAPLSGRSFTIARAPWGSSYNRIRLISSIGLADRHSHRLCPQWRPPGGPPLAVRRRRRRHSLHLRSCWPWLAAQPLAGWSPRAPKSRCRLSGRARPCCTRLLNSWCAPPCAV